MSENRTPSSWTDPDDAPDLSVSPWREKFAAAPLMRGEDIVRPGRPPLPDDERKQLVSLRLSPALLAHFRASGPGWQTRINDVLEAHVAREKTEATK